MPIRIVIRWIVAAGLAAAGIWILLPGRNLVGNPAFEREIRSCRLPGGGIVRLYEGNGGATTAFWYTVTHEGGWWSLERQILYSYGIPEVREIACMPVGIGITFWDGANETRESLPLGRVRSAYRRHPVVLRMGERVESVGNPFRWISLALGLVLLGVGLLVVRSAARAIKLES